MSTQSMVERHIKLFKNGRNQAVRIRREFERFRKHGQRLLAGLLAQGALALAQRIVVLTQVGEKTSGQVSVSPPSLVGVSGSQKLVSGDMRNVGLCQG